MGFKRRLGDWKKVKARNFKAKMRAKMTRLGDRLDAKKRKTEEES